MKKIVVFLTLLVGCLQIDSAAQIMWQISGDKVVQWYYQDGDEFNANHIDTTKWQSSFPWGRNLYCNKEQQYYTDWKNHRLNNGVLQLVAQKENITGKIVSWESDKAQLKCGEVVSGPNTRSFQYTSGMIFSKNKFHYGYYEIRFKSSNGKGLWPAFWLYAGHESDEIDIFEIKGERNSEMHVDVHCANGCRNYKTTLGMLRKNWGDYLPATSAWHEGYNVIGLEWRPGFLKWYLNGEGVAYWKGKFEFPMWVIANLAIPSDNGPFGPGPDANTQFPTSLDIDYIRIWSPSPAAKKQRATLSFIPSVNRNTANAKPAALARKKRPEYKRANLKQESVMMTFAKISDGEVLITVNGDPGDGYSIEVTDEQGKVKYQSSDPAVLEHLIRVPSTGDHHLIMTLQGKRVEHHF